MREYQVGDKVWWAKCGREGVTVPCPVCFGKREVTLILGNDDTVTLPCDYCGKGFRAPTGTVTEYKYIAEPQEVTITAIQTETNAKGSEHRYYFDTFSLDNDVICETEEEAKAKCAEIAEKRRIDAETRAENIKHSQAKSYAWNAGYHMREAKRAEKAIEYHKKMAVICKARSKDRDN